jgi:hypothetical protein
VQLNKQQSQFQDHYNELSKLNDMVTSILPGPDPRGDSLSSKLEDLREADRVTIHPSNGPTIVLFEPIPVSTVGSAVERDVGGRLALDLSSATADMAHKTVVSVWDVGTTAAVFVTDTLVTQTPVTKPASVVFTAPDLYNPGLANSRSPGPTNNLMLPQMRVVAEHLWNAYFIENDKPQVTNIHTSVEVGDKKKRKRDPENVVVDDMKTFKDRTRNVADESMSKECERYHHLLHLGV